MQSYLFSTICNWIKGQCKINQDVEFSYIITDSRSVLYPEKSLFIAISGGNHNGHDYIPSLYQQGVRCFLVQDNYQILPEFDKANYLIVNNTLQSFQELAAHKRSLYQIPVVGITGSNGKTIVKEWISQLIGKSKVVVRSPKSYNSQIGVPLSVWQLHNGTEVGVFEAGISLVGEMQKIASVINPTIGVLTNLGAAHQENFTSRKEKLHEKLKLFKNAELIIFNGDESQINAAVKEEYPLTRTFAWGSASECNLQVLYKSINGNSTTIKLKWKGKIFEVEIPFVDYTSYENVMHALAVLINLGFTTEYITSATTKLVPVAMRMELKEGVNGCTLINDSYNSDISSLAISLDFLNQQSRSKDGDKTLILSDIYQSGIDNESLCGQINNLIVKKGITRLIGVGNVLKSNSFMFELKAEFFATTQDFLDNSTHNHFKNETILIKGSRNFEFEKVSAFLEQRHHQTCLEINLNALVHNLNYYRGKLNESTKVLAMVKAFSYGSGSFEIANVLQHQKVDYLGVAFADEGVELRKAGISLPIIVMNPEVKSFGTMINYQLEPEIYSFKVLDEFVQELDAEGVNEHSIHVKLDTGMNRLGFDSSDVEVLIKTLKNYPQLRVKSVFSHLVGADDKNLDDFTHSQIVLFGNLTEQIEIGLGYKFIKHILNSAGILRFPDAQFDMVRIGIGMYGIGAVEQFNLKPVSRFKSYISQIRLVKANQTVGYNRKGKLPYDAEIAVVPVGYADGLRRRLGNGVGRMVVNNQLSTIIGNVCMDMCMLDVTGLNAKEGDEVEIFGNELSVDEVAAALDTIPYEIFTSISRRVKRVYFME